jgi:hypothetical protein
MYEKPAGPLSIGAVVNDAFRLYRASFNRAWVPALIMQLMITAALVFVRLQSPELVDAEGLAFDVRKVEPSLLVVYLLAVFVSLVFSNAITAQLLAVRERRDLSIGGSIAVGARFFPPTLGMAFLLGAAGSVITVIAAAALALLPSTTQRPLTILCMLLAGYLVGRIYLASVPLIGDRAGVLGSIRASWRVTRGHWWRASIIMSVVLALFVLALFGMQLCAGVVYLVVRSGTVSGLLAVQLVSAVIQAATVPFFNAGCVATFYDLKLRGQGTGLPDRVEALDNP